MMDGRDRVSWVERVDWVGWIRLIAIAGDAGQGAKSV